MPLKAQRLSMLVWASFLFLSACSAPPKGTTAFQKNPDVLPQNQNQIDPTITRTLLEPIQFDSSFLSQLSKKDSSGFYEPDNCVQWVRLDQNGTTLGTFLEVSAVPCNGGNDPIEEDSVLLRLRVKQHPQYFTQYRLYFGHAEHEHEVGIFRKLTINGSVEYRLEGLCDISNGYWVGNDANAWKSVCSIAIEGSLFRSPSPFEVFK